MIKPTKALVTLLLVAAAILFAQQYAGNTSANSTGTNANPATQATPAKAKKIEYSEEGYLIGPNGELYKPGETADNPQKGY